MYIQEVLAYCLYLFCCT